MDKSHTTFETPCKFSINFEGVEEMSWHWKEKNAPIVMSEIEKREGKPFDEVVEEARCKYEEVKGLKK